MGCGPGLKHQKHKNRVSIVEKAEDAKKDFTTQLPPLTEIKKETDGRKPHDKVLEKKGTVRAVV